MSTPMEKKLCALADKNFKRDLASRLKKLGEEFSELAEAVCNRDYDAIRLESADCSFVLMDICHLTGGSLSGAQKAKWRVIEQRVKNGTLHKGKYPAHRPDHDAIEEGSR